MKFSIIYVILVVIDNVQVMLKLGDEAMKKLLPFLLIIMLVVAGGTSYYAYATYKDSKVDDKEIVENTEQENNISNTNDLSWYPQRIQDGEFTTRYYDMFVDYQAKSKAFAIKVDSIMGSSRVYSNEIIGQMKPLYIEHITYLNSLNFSPSTQIENEVDEYLWSTKYNYIEQLEYMVKYFDTGDYMYYDMSLDFMEKRRSDYELALAVMDRYKLLD